MHVEQAIAAGVICSQVKWVIRKALYTTLIILNLDNSSEIIGSNILLDTESIVKSPIMCIEVDPVQLLNF